MELVIGIVMFGLICVGGYRLFKAESLTATRNLRLEMSKRKSSPEVYALMRKAGYDV